MRPCNLSERTGCNNLLISKRYGMADNSKSEAAMARCSDPRPLSELDPVTFFIVTELMAAEREVAGSSAEDRSDIPLFEFANAKVA